MTTYAVNQNGATTRYGNYGFDSFCKGPDGRYYGIKADGLYLLEGTTDSTIDFGDLNFGTSALKAILPPYVACGSDDKLMLTVTQNEVDYDYLSRGYDATMKVQRFDVGKGLRSNYFGVKLSNIDGSDFTIDAVEVPAKPLSRRI